MRANSAIVGLGLVVTIAACERIPGTDAHSIAKAEGHAAAVLFDPAAAQFRNTSLHPIPADRRQRGLNAATRVVCGEINGKNRNGAYVGFSRFLADPDNAENVVIEPTSTVTKEEVDAAVARCSRGAREPLYSEVERELRLEQCRRARDLANEAGEVARFEILYELNCPTKATQ